MCGRFSLGSTADALSYYFGLKNLQLPLEPKWNISPGQNILAIRLDDLCTKSPALLHWGLIPPWAKEKGIGYKMINARAETITEKPSFRSAFKTRRCLIPADGFYEWQKTDQSKKPFHIRKTDSGLFAFAGIWERWIDKQTQELIESCAILTTEANDLIRPIHNRMPVILTQEEQKVWLHDEAKNLIGLLQPHNWQGFQAVQVSDYVNKAGNEGKQCVEPVG